MKLRQINFSSVQQKKKKCMQCSHALCRRRRGRVGMDRLHATWNRLSLRSGPSPCHTSLTTDLALGFLIRSSYKLHSDRENFIHSESPQTLIRFPQRQHWEQRRTSWRTLDSWNSTLNFDGEESILVSTLCTYSSRFSNIRLENWCPSFPHCGVDKWWRSVLVFLLSIDTGLEFPYFEIGEES